MPKRKTTVPSSEAINKRTKTEKPSTELQLCIKGCARFKTYNAVIGESAAQEASRAMRLAEDELGEQLTLKKIVIGSRETKLSSGMCLPQNPVVGTTRLQVTASTADNSSFWSAVMEIKAENAEIRAENGRMISRLTRVEDSLRVLASNEVMQLANQVLMAGAYKKVKRKQMTEDEEKILTCIMSNLARSTAIRDIFSTQDARDSHTTLHNFASRSVKLRKARNAVAHMCKETLEAQLIRAQEHLPLLEHDQECQFACFVVRNSAWFLKLVR